MQYIIPIVIIIASLFLLVFVTENSTRIPDLGFGIIIIALLGLVIYSIATIIQSRPVKKSSSQDYIDRIRKL